jgi:hypothetical protein
MTTDSNTNAARMQRAREALIADMLTFQEKLIREGADGDAGMIDAAISAIGDCPSPASAPEQAQPRAQAEACQQGAETTTGWKVEDHGADGMIVRDPSGMERSRIGNFMMAMVHLAMVLEEHDKLRAALSPRPSDVREQQAEQIAKLQRFKDWVHAYLDAQGVPHHPPGTHGAEGCRIGDRMDWLMDRLRKAEAQQAEQGDGGCPPRPRRARSVEDERTTQT